MLGAPVPVSSNNASILKLFVVPPAFVWTIKSPAAVSGVTSTLNLAQDSEIVLVYGWYSCRCEEHRQPLDNSTIMWLNRVMYNYITSTTQISPLLSKLQEVKEVSLDIECTSLNPFTMTILLLQIGIGEEIYVLDIRKLGLKFLTYIVALICDLNITVIGHNIKFDIKALFSIFWTKTK